MPETVDQCKKLALPNQGDAFAEQMLDIHGERLEIMTRYNVELFVLSLASPGPQGERDREKAEVEILNTGKRLATHRLYVGTCPSSERLHGRTGSQKSKAVCGLLRALDA